MPLTRHTLAAVLTACCLSAMAHAADRPQAGEHFSRNQISAETNLPDTIDPAASKNIKWTFKLGTDVHASPTIANGKILIGSNNEDPKDPRHKGDRGTLYCLDEKTGKFLWQLVVPKITEDIYRDWPHIGITGSATIEGDRAYLLTNRTEMVCLDLAGQTNGNDGPFKDEAKHQTPAGKAEVPIGETDADILWLTDLESEVGIYHHDTAYGNALIDGDFIYMNSCNGVDLTHKVIRKPDAPSLLVYDKKTGRIIATDNEHIGPRIVHAAWSSPSLGILNGRKLIFFGGGDGVVYAFDALKEIPPEGARLTLNRVFKFDCDPAGPKEKVGSYAGNRETSPSDILTMPVYVDGKIYATAGGDIWWGKNQSWLKCIDAEKAAKIGGDVTLSAQLWSYEMKRQCGSTPAVTPDLTYVCDVGQINCVETATGKPVWSHKTKGDLWSSCLVADGKVYVGSMRGEFFIFAAGREKKILCETRLNAPIAATPVAANGVLYITTNTTLYALSK